MTPRAFFALDELINVNCWLPISRIYSFTLTSPANTKIAVIDRMFLKEMMQK